jgi:protein HIRA/HIR1
MYVKRLGAEGLKGKIEELLRSLTGDLIAGDDDDDDSEEKQEEVICGWKREELVKEVVLILGMFLQLRT